MGWVPLSPTTGELGKPSPVPSWELSHFPAGANWGQEFSSVQDSRSSSRARGWQLGQGLCPCSRWERHLAGSFRESAAFSAQPKGEGQPSQTSAGLRAGQMAGKGSCFLRRGSWKGRKFLSLSGQCTCLEEIRWFVLLFYFILYFLSFMLYYFINILFYFILILFYFSTIFPMP